MAPFSSQISRIGISNPGHHCLSGFHSQTTRSDWASQVLTSSKSSRLGGMYRNFTTSGLNLQTICSRS